MASYFLGLAGWPVGLAAAKTLNAVWHRPGLAINRPFQELVGIGRVGEGFCLRVKRQFLVPHPAGNVSQVT
jgi:hypothetical protein